MNGKANSQDSTSAEVPEQTRASWGLALNVGWGSLHRRLMRSMVTMLGVVLAIAFLTYMLVFDSIIDALIAANDDTLNVLLQKAGIEILVTQGTDSMMLLLISLALLTCLAGIINSMLMAVTERIKEIGTLKCLGALDSFIVKTYLVESTIQGMLGTVLGMVGGLVVALAVTLHSFGRFVFPNLPAQDVGKSLAVALVIGAVLSIGASILPAWLAAKKEPVDAMRVEN